MATPQNDPISDMLTRIRNAVSNNFEFVEIPATKLKADIAKLLKEAGFISSVKTVKKQFPTLVIELKDSSRPITALKRISTPGRRIYNTTSQIRAVRGGQGLTIISTSQGVMTGRQARQRRLGGEVICEVY